MVVVGGGGAWLCAPPPKASLLSMTCSVRNFVSLVLNGGLVVFGEDRVLERHAPAGNWGINSVP